MKPAAFDYVRAERIEEALDVLAQEGADARVLAGGQTLIPMLSMRMARPSVVIDIMRLPGLDRIESAEGTIRVGAAVRQRHVEQYAGLVSSQPLLAAALPWIGHAQTRNRGTVCGSVAHADPSAEMPLVLIALGVGYAFREIGRRHGDFAIVACAARVDARTARLAIGGVADRPTLRDLPLPGDPGLDDALDAFAWDLEARDDLHATAEYRHQLVRRLGRQTLEEAARCRG
jgi:2-furoyl-CoA dehydrogenase FAD binding subunit